MADQIGVLLIVNRLEHGGAEHMLITLAKHLLDGPFRPLVACLKDAGPLADKLRNRPIPVYADLLHHKFDVAVLLRLRRIIRRESVGVVLSVGSGGDRMFWSTLAARWCKTKTVIWSHIFPDRAHPQIESINQMLYGWVHRFVAIGQRHRNALVELENVPESRITVIGNGIDVDRFDRPNRRPAVRADLGLNDHNVALAILANLRQDKRHDLFIQAAQILARRYPDTRFYIIGDGPRREDVHRLAKATELLDKQIFLLGARDDIPDLIQAFDILCLCSEWQECFPISMLEAMAAGKAFVAPDTGSLDEALIDGQTGRFLPKLSVDALVDTLADLIDDPARRASLGQAARLHVRQNFTADAMARRFENMMASECLEQQKNA
jgi:glycosyltransferase involved in cell wall biosynthesis